MNGIKWNLEAWIKKKKKNEQLLSHSFSLLLERIQAQTAQKQFDITLLRVVQFQ